MNQRIFTFTGKLAAILLLLCICLGVPAAASARQPKRPQVTVSGTVYNQQYHPLGGVVVTFGRIKTKTDKQGNYSIKLPSGDYPVYIRCGNTTLDFDTLTFSHDTQLTLGIQQVS
ncbi:MAG: hypothetical protein H6Q75_714 [Firmicutes bacterium]|nr:hypothetical protein [Bacillota bacterium]